MRYVCQIKNSDIIAFCLILYYNYIKYMLALIKRVASVVAQSVLITGLIAITIPYTTPVRKYVTTGDECYSHYRYRTNDFIEENYPGWRYYYNWKYEVCVDEGSDRETWMVMMTRNVSFIQMIYWKLTGYVM